MISSNTLAAFSAGIKGLQSSGIQLPGVQATRVAAPAASAAPVQKQLQALPSPGAGRASPRGSLLDLSV